MNGQDLMLQYTLPQVHKARDLSELYYCAHAQTTYRVAIETHSRTNCASLDNILIAILIHIILQREDIILLLEFKYMLLLLMESIFSAQLFV